MKFEPTVREEELKNRVAALYFSKYDCTRIVGNIDFCVSIKRKDPHQMTFIYEAPSLWAEAKNHPTDFNAIKSRFGENHWIPFTEAEVDAKNCFKSHFMSDILNGRGVLTECMGQEDLFAVATSNPVNPVNPVKNNFNSAANPVPLNIKDNLSFAARAVLDAGRELWRYYHAQPNANPNASYYDIRAHFQGCKPNGTMNAKSNDATYNSLLATLRAAHKALASEIELKVYEYGFLKR